MKLTKTASGKRQLKLSQKEWQSIGKKAGWLKKAQSGPQDEDEDRLVLPITDRARFNRFMNDEEPSFAAEYDDYWQDNLEHMEQLCEENSRELLSFGFDMDMSGFDSGDFWAKTRRQDGVVLEGEVDMYNREVGGGYLAHERESGDIPHENIVWHSIELEGGVEDASVKSGKHINGRDLTDREIQYIQNMYGQTLAKIIYHGEYMNEDDLLKELDSPEYEGYRK